MGLRVFVLGALAVLVFSGATAAAVALPARCPEGYRYAIDPACVAEATTVAPDGTPTRDFTDSLDQRWALRLEIAGLGLAIAAALLTVSAHVWRKHLLQVREVAEPA